MFCFYLHLHVCLLPISNWFIWQIILQINCLLLISWYFRHAKPPDWDICHICPLNDNICTITDINILIYFCVFHVDFYALVLKSSIWHVYVTELAGLLFTVCHLLGFVVVHLCMTQIHRTHRPCLMTVIKWFHHLCNEPLLVAVKQTHLNCGSKLQKKKKKNHFDSQCFSYEGSSVCGSIRSSVCRPCVQYVPCSLSVDVIIGRWESVSNCMSDDWWHVMGAPVL